MRSDKKDRVAVASARMPCMSDHHLIYNFEPPVNQGILEHFKPFGDVTVKGPLQSNLWYFKLKLDNLFKISGTIRDSKITTISLSFDAQRSPEAKDLFEKQLTRALNCIGCGGCIGTCPFGAISISSDHFKIDSNKCVHCKKCIRSICMTLNFKTERKIIKAHRFA